MKRILYLVTLISCVGTALLSPIAHSQGILKSQGLEWSLSKGVRSADSNSDFLCIPLPDVSNRSEPAIAVARVSLPEKQAWTVSFALRFGPLKKKAAGILFRHGETVICQVLADGFTGNMGGSIGKDMPLCVPINVDWHNFIFASSGRTLSLWHEGKKVASVSCADVPDNIKLSGSAEPTAEGQEPIVSVRNLILKTGNEPSVSEQTVSSIEDTFVSGPLPGLWIVKPNSGSISKRGSELQFLPSKYQDSFGIMTSREGTLPAGSSWKVSVHFRFPQRGPYGIGLGIQNSKNKDQRPFWMHYDDNLKLPRLLMNNHEFVLQNPGEWHDLSVANDKGHWTVQMDSKQVLSGDFDPTDYTLYFGNDVPSIKAWGWTTLALQSVQIDYTSESRPSWLADLVKAQSQVTSQPSTSSSTPTGSGTGQGVPSKTTQPRTLTGQSAVVIPVTSDAAIKLSRLDFRYIDTYRTEPARGFLSKIRGVWIISIDLINETDKPIWVIPGTLVFDNRAFEGLYPQIDWKFYHQDVVVGGPKYGVPEIPLSATYYSPVAGASPVKCLEPGKRTTIDLFAENGGGWRYATHTYRNGPISGSTSGDEAIERQPVSLNLLCVQDPDAVQKALDSLYATQSLGTQSGPDTLGRCRALDRLKTQLKPPPPKDPLWVNIPITKATLSIGAKNIRKIF